MSDRKALPNGAYEDALRRVVNEKFGYTALRPEQERLIRASIEGHDVLGVLPTGSGKSACFQIPGIVTNSRTLVISPLIALQDNQVATLRQMGVQAFAWHSNLPDSRRQAAAFFFKSAPRDQAAFLYAAPESLTTENFYQVFGGAGFDRLVIDEAHCVSTWGNTFRPDYLRTGTAAQRFAIPQCAAFTATIDPRIERDIRGRTPLAENCVRVCAEPSRPNLELQVRRPTDADDATKVKGAKKLTELFRLLDERAYRGATIIYCSTREGAFSLLRRLQPRILWFKQRRYTLHLFHGYLPYEEKEQALRGFLSEPRPIVVATSAFGMGIDRPDVRQIIHYNTPYSLVDYAQQIGRSGRDGKPARCTILHTSSDLLHEEVGKLSAELPSFDFVERIHRRLRDLVENMEPEKRQGYTVGRFLRREELIAEKSPKIKDKHSYLARVRRTLPLLERAGVIGQEDVGLVIRPIEPGSVTHETLLELTQMHVRAQLREKARLVRFFDSPTLSQEQLWELLQEE